MLEDFENVVVYLIVSIKKKNKKPVHMFSLSGQQKGTKCINTLGAF